MTHDVSLSFVEPPQPSAGVLEFGSAGVIVEHTDGRIASVNAAAARMLGTAPDELVGRAVATLCAADERSRHSTLRAELADGRRVSASGRWRYLRRDGTTFETDVVVSRVTAASGAPQVLVSVLHERAGTLPGERLESLGLLAGGVAHDFNNVLAVMRGNLEFARDALLEPLPDVPAALADLQEVDKAAERATALVRQLLAFGRLQARSPEPLDVNGIVRDLTPLLRVSVGDELYLTLRLATDLPRVHADRTQLEQVLMNLVVNARDAIGEAMAAERAADGATAIGRRHGITLATAAESVGAAAVARTGVPRSGEYVRLEVRDTGIGMTDATRARIFEPFFTTKSVDRGTGLGLAATWGIVMQSGGGIHVESEYSAGSAFVIYLPTMPPDGSDGVPPHEAPEAAVTPRSAGANGAPRMDDDVSDEVRRTVLLAEDDHAVRRVTGRILRAAGYRVLEAGDGQSALDLWRAHAEEIDLLLADVRMPRLRGDALAALVSAESPGLPVVLITGYGDEPAAHGDGRNGSDAPMRLVPLAKPFTAGGLLERIAAALAAAGADSAAR